MTPHEALAGAIATARQDAADMGWPADTQPGVHIPMKVAEELLRGALAAACEAGAQDFHESHRADRAPDFTEAAGDYATAAIGSGDLAALLAEPAGVGE